MSTSATIFPFDNIFHSLAEQRARLVLDRLDPNLRTTVRLIGIRFHTAVPKPLRAEFLVIPLEAEIGPSDFADLAARARQAQACDSDGTALPAPPMMALQRAMSAALDVVDARDERRSFCGPPVVLPHEDLDVDLVIVPVIRVDAATFARHESLGRASFPVSAVTSARIATSLMDAAILELFEHIEDGLLYPRPLREEVGRFIPEEILHRAAVRLMNTPEAAADVQALEQLSKACDQISVMKYEGGEARGRLIIAVHDHPALETVLAFTPPISISDHRAVRKLLELSWPRSTGLGLVTDGQSIRGLATIAASYDAESESCFTVDFLANGVWELGHAGSPLMVVRYGQPELPRSPIAREALGNLLRAIEPGFAEEAEARIWQGIEAATNGGHGALLVVSREAEGEAVRLRPQVLPITAIPLTPDLVGRTTSIDGALLIGVDGRCHAIGAILDGTADGSGDASRGSRYNSAVRYVNSRKGAAFAIVVSEDGMVNLIPPAALDGAC